MKTSKIPDIINGSSILDAINEIDNNGVPKRRRHTKYCLLYKGRVYPPKYVISIAHKKITGIEFDSNDFYGGYQSNRFLSDFGFEIISDQEARKQGYVWYSVY